MGKLFNGPKSPHYNDKQKEILRQLKEKQFSSTLMLPKKYTFAFSKSFTSIFHYQQP